LRQNRASLKRIPHRGRELFPESHSSPVIERSQTRFWICLERGIGADKSLSLAAQFYQRASEQGMDRPSIDSRYRAPARYDGTFRYASDVFVFGLILFEILAAWPAFPESLNRWQIACMVAVAEARPKISESVPATAVTWKKLVLKSAKALNLHRKRNAALQSQKRGMAVSAPPVVFVH
jgi:TPR repeat protein